MSATPRPRRRRAVTVWAVGLFLAALVGCSDSSDGGSENTTEGDVDRGREALAEYGCGSCHRVPGVEGADGLVAPPLDAFGQRSYIAGEVPNTHENLVRWITDPDSVEPGTAMPDLDVTDEDAVDISAYLLSLE